MAADVIPHKEKHTISTTDDYTDLWPDVVVN